MLEIRRCFLNCYKKGKVILSVFFANETESDVSFGVKKCACVCNGNTKSRRKD